MGFISGTALLLISFYFSNFQSSVDCRVDQPAVLPRRPVPLSLMGLDGTGHETGTGRAIIQNRKSVGPCGKSARSARALSTRAPLSAPSAAVPRATRGSCLRSTRVSRPPGVPQRAT